MEIISLTPDQTIAIEAAAKLLVDGFRELAPNAWPDFPSALDEVRDSFGDDRLSRIAIAENGEVLGWIGGIRHYNGYSWELHPLVVARSHQRRGIGRKLVADLEQQVRLRGGYTIFVGTDDETGLTSLAGIDLYPNPLQHLATIQNDRGHPYEFYQKVGFKIVGVIPDANGFGKPDIFMAKRVAASPLSENA